MRVVVLVAALLVSGCGAQAARGTAHDSAAAPATPAAFAASASRKLMKLDGTQWQFVQVGGVAVPPGVVPTIRLRGGRASGKAGCNGYGARYQLDADGALSFSQVVSTKMACIAPVGAMQVEHRIFAALRNVAKVEMRDGALVFLDADGSALARLEPADKP